MVTQIINGHKENTPLNGNFFTNNGEYYFRVSLHHLLYMSSITSLHLYVTQEQLDFFLYQNKSLKLVRPTWILLLPLIHAVSVYVLRGVHDRFTMGILKTESVMYSTYMFSSSKFWAPYYHR